MLSCPLHNKAHCARRESASNHCKRMDVHDDLITTVFRVKMRWIVIIVIHFDNNAIKAT